MDENTLWAFIETARAGGGGPRKIAERLALALSEQDDADIFAYADAYRRINERAETRKMWAAQVALTDFDGPDRFEYFRNWTISLGERAYRAALEDPQTLFGPLTELEKPQDFLEAEALIYVPEAAYKLRNGIEDPDAELDAATAERLDVSLASLEPPAESGEPEDDLKPSLQFPKLAALRLASAP